MRWMKLHVVLRQSYNFGIRGAKWRAGWFNEPCIWERFKAHSAFAFGLLFGIQIMELQRLKSDLKILPQLEVLHASQSLESLTNQSGKRSQIYNFIADAVDEAAPAVVYIEVIAKQQHYFHNIAAISSGSGFIVSSDGMVLTNAHVVNQAMQVNVKLSDGRSMKGVVVDIDPVADLAAVKLVNTAKVSAFS